MCVKRKLLCLLLGKRHVTREKRWVACEVLGALKGEVKGGGVDG